MPEARIKIQRGSDVKLNFRLTVDGSPMNISGRTVKIFDEKPALKERINAEIEDPVAGLIAVRIAGKDPILLGVHSFRVQIENSEKTIALPVLEVEVV